MNQPWEGNQLDKDLLGDKLYSPETCVFIPQWLNKLFTDSGAARGEYPIGVSKNRRGFLALISIDGKNKYIGHFETPQLARVAYATAKADYVRSKYHLLEPRLQQACERKI